MYKANQPTQTLFNFLSLGLKALVNSSISRSLENYLNYSELNPIWKTFAEISIWK